ncbi:ABC transporter family substrate-binding protein [Streptomyces albireticuli]|uniref:ABC transporter substrate-binding protein n=1 Tax=Streptomyces albireticuli TaxID=1940 RepID=A0A2A2D1P1_9ACTN|nr:ABC transporter family substrate-binding protein [Streptomyces albireticuli]MCD9142498.1 ABC transporter family substrate-binding protein [Streptomyces albireticuli]MCD9163898.1 ABC transporter family substrate-binding protein [Streptomyces albireticuli]MCD9192626.1 ABC transporter family substrate-binding protein [Streptomyces albireticuli]PAU45377.1 ABC transporter substrate-binding protein [Streptomyces albireticuli]
MISAVRAAAVVAATVSAALVLTACGGGGSGSADDDAQGKAAPAAGTQDLNPHPAADIKQGGVYKVAIQQWINQYNPNQTDGTQGDASAITELVEPDLFTFDAKGVPHSNPDFLASAKVVSTDPQVVSYELNPKAKWSDGKPLGVADFEAQWKALSGKDKGYQVATTSGYDQIAKVERGKDDHEVRVTFATPFADWQRLFDPLLPASLNADPDSFNKSWAGTVPVTSNAWKVGQYDKTAKTITLVPDPAWWGEKPKLDKYIFWAMDGTARTDAYLNKEIHETPAVTPEAYKRLKDDKDTDFRVGARWDQVTLSLNGGRGPLQDVKVRQAVTLGVDREALVKVAGKDLPFQPKVVNNHFFMPNQEGYKDNAGAFAKRDVARAKKLLDEAGWKDGGAGKPRVKDGKPLTLEYVMPSDANGLAEDQAKLTQQMLGEIGVKTELRKVPGDDYFDRYVHRSNYDLTQFRQVDRVYRSDSYQDYRQPDGDNSFGNYGRVSSPEVDKLMVEASRTTDPQKQIALYNEADAKVWELGHSLPLYQRPQILAVRKGLANTGAPGLGSETSVRIGWLK